MAETQIAIRDNWLARSVAWTLRAARLIHLVETPTEFEAGSDYASGLPTKAGYDPKRAMSAYPANVWLAAAVNAVATDLAGVPIRVSRAGDRRDIIDDHPLLDLLAKPESMTSEELWRQQWYTDALLSGNAYHLILQSSIRGGMPVGLSRMHPARIKIVPATDGEPRAYEYTGGTVTRTYMADAVMHVHGPSWQDDPKGLYGQGVVQPLDADLVADLAHAEASAKAATNPRPAAVYSPASDKTVWNTKQVHDMTAAVGKLIKDNDQGVAVLSGHGKLSILGWSPADLESVKLREWTRQGILAILDVPPARVGLETTNYATATAQMISYWQGLRGRARLFDAELTRIANMFGGPEVVVWHDFTRIPWLQQMQTDALARVKQHIANGVDPVKAYQYEGFDAVDETWFVPTAEPAQDDSASTRAAIGSTRDDLSAAARAIEAGDAPVALSLLDDARESLRVIR